MSNEPIRNDEEDILGQSLALEQMSAAYEVLKRAEYMKEFKPLWVALYAGLCLVALFGLVIVVMHFLEALEWWWWREAITIAFAVLGCVWLPVVLGVFGVCWLRSRYRVDRWHEKRHVIQFDVAYFFCGILVFLSLSSGVPLIFIFRDLSAAFFALGGLWFPFWIWMFLIWCEEKPVEEIVYFRGRCQGPALFQISNSLHLLWLLAISFFGFVCPFLEIGGLTEWVTNIGNK